MKTLIKKSLSIQILILSVIRVGLLVTCWFGICQLLTSWFNFSTGVLLTVIALVSVTTTGVVLLVVRQKIFASLRLIQQHNLRQISECTPDDCAVMLISENRIPHGEIGELMKSRNTMLKHLEQTLRELQRNYQRIKELEKIKDDLSHMIIHDLKNPLGIMLLTLDIVKSKNKISKEQLNLIQQAQKSGQEMNRMIHNLLDISKMEEGKLTLNKSSVNLHEFISETIADVRSSGMLEGRSLTFKTRDPELKIIADLELLRRVVINLVSNAVKHTKSDGLIELCLESLSNGQAVRIVVADNGEGIAKEFHQKIFEKFEQVNIKDQRSGTGLGLAFCKLTVEAHGGRIWVESEVGHGSTFYLEFPCQSFQL